MRPCHKIYLAHPDTAHITCAKKINIFLCQLLIFGVPLLNANLRLGLGLALVLGLEVMLELVLELFSCWFWLTLTHLLLHVSLDDRRHLVYSSELFGWKIATYRLNAHFNPE